MVPLLSYHGEVEENGFILFWECDKTLSGYHRMNISIRSIHGKDSKGYIVNRLTRYECMQVLDEKITELKSLTKLHPIFLST